MLITLKKKTCLGVLDRGERDDDNETSLKEEGGIEMSTTVLPYLHVPVVLILDNLCKQIFRA